MLYMHRVPAVCVRACAERCLALCDPRGLPRQAPLSAGFSGQEYWSGLPFPSPGGPLEPGVEAASLTSPAIVGGFFTTEPARKPFPHSSAGEESAHNAETWV